MLARTVRSPEELARHLDFGRFERLVIRRLVAPFAQLAARYLTMPCDPTRMIVDEWMYAGERAGARHFLRFGYPSVLPAVICERIAALTGKVLRELGFRHGFFNCELFVMPDGSLRFIEVNPGMASQLVRLYRDVDGRDVYRMLVALAADYPGARLALYPKRGRSLAREYSEYKWLGSHRYAVLNLGAADAEALDRAHARICERFGWPCVRPDPASIPHFPVAASLSS